MQCINIKNYTEKILPFIILFCLFSFHTNAQSTYIPLKDKQYDVLDRLEIKSGNEGNIFSTVKPYKRTDAVALIKAIDSMEHRDVSYAYLSNVDKYDMHSLLMDNSEWSGPRDTYLSSKPVFGPNGIYKTKDNLFELNKPDLFLAINPVIYFTGGKEENNSTFLYQNTRGISVRGLVDSKVGFDMYFTDNQERDNSYVLQYITTNDALPGVGNYKKSLLNRHEKLDYFDARGSVNWKLCSHVDMQFGFDKNIIGDGYRSLLLSDFSNSTTFLKTDLKIWKLNYENIIMELYSPHNTSGNIVFPKKYARFSDLSINAAKWLNAGIFEGEMFDRTDNFSLQYLVPVMFFKPIGSAGNNENEVLGIHAKANIAHHAQIYAQTVFDELNFSEVFSNSWKNKSGFQLGVKYIDAFGFHNLDLQAEMNQVRPFTYAYSDSTGNYSHYNQPLAHPLGANFREFVGIVKVHPLPQLRLQATFIHFFQGLDSAGINYGSNIFENYNTRPFDNGFDVGIGNRATCDLFSGVASYEIKENMFLELTGIYRKYSVATNTSNSNSTSIYLSFRWNIARRDFNF